MNDTANGHLARPRALAELARAGYSSLRHPTMDVDFEVLHFQDRPGYLADRYPPDRSAPPYLETLVSTANGAGLVIGTDTSRVPDETRYRKHGGMLDRQPEQTAIEGGLGFRGSARPNLTFLLETGPRFEAMVAVDTTPSPMTMSHAKQLREVLYKINEISQSAGAPVLSVQSPVQLPIEPKADYNLDDIPPAASKAIRFAIALPTPNARLSLEIGQQIAMFCEHRKFALWLRDTRPGCRSGNWYPVLAESGTRTWPAIELTWLLPVTFVGPARLGSDMAILNSLSDLPEIGVAACSTALLDDLAFIHLQLALPHRVNGLPTENEVVGMDPDTFIRRVLAPAVGRDKVLAVEATATDYQTFAGPQLPYRPPDHDRRISIWFSWQMNHVPEGLAAALGSLTAAFQRIGLKAGGTAQARFEYLVCRDLGNSLFRGKGRLSVPDWFITSRFPRPRVESAQSQFCVALEDAWKAAAVRNTAANIREITVSWREHWLGHWAVPIT